MSDAVTDVALRLTVKDVNSPQAAKAVEQGFGQAQRRMRQEAEQTGKASERASSQMVSRSVAEFRKLSSARETLGVRSEQAIQREIQQTEAAYNRLMRSGSLSLNEQRRATAAMRDEVARLNAELGKVEKRPLSERLGRVANVAGTVAAGVAGGYYAMREPARRAMDFDERLAHMANTAFGSRDAVGRRAGMGQLEGAINRSIMFGGTRDAAAEALDTLIASGAVAPDAAMTMLPQIMKSSNASGADPAALAQIGINAMRSFRIKAEDFPAIMNMAMAAGQAGGFELKDMAKWLPQQMAAASLSGLSGRGGFAKLAAINQAAAITAGTKDEAGNNVVNLLAKINSADTAKDAKKLGIDLPAYLQAQRGQGVDSIDAFVGLVDRSVSGRADYKALQKRLASTRDPGERREALESMATIAQGAGIGQLIQDRQALMALLGLMNNREYVQDVLGKIRKNDVNIGGEIDTAQAVIEGTAAFKTRRLGQQKDAAQKAGLDSVTPALGGVADWMGGMAQDHPLLASAATTVLPSAGGAVAGMGLWQMMTNPGSLKTGAAWAAQNLPRAVPAAGSFAAAAAPLSGMAYATQWAGDTSQDSERISWRKGLGDAIASVLRSLGIDREGDIEARRARNREGLLTEEVKTNATITVALAPGLVVTGQSVSTTGNGNVQVNTGNLWSAPR